VILSNITITINIIIYFKKKTQRIKIDRCLKKYNQRVAMGTHVKIHVLALLDRAKIVVPKTTKIFGSGTRTGVTGLRRPVEFIIQITV
jgi:hypothetical protein